MKSHAQVVVIGGGVVGCSVLYHLTKLGWNDVVLLERLELTSGSSWHAAGGFHTINGDPNVAKLQSYTIDLYKEIEELSGQSCGLHITGGVLLAGTQERMDFLRVTHAKGRNLNLGTELISATEAHELFPLMDPTKFVGALYSPRDGHLDPSGVTHAYAKAAKNNGATIERNCKVVETNPLPDGTWEVVCETGTIIAQHVVNAGGLWAREVGRMVGLELPILAMEHMYLLTDDMPEVKAINESTGKEVIHAVDFEGELYLRQERGGMLMGTYERACVPWSEKETPWDFGHELLQPDIDRIAPSLEVGFEHFPPFAEAGIRQVINGPFTFAPDGNPIVGPVRGLQNYWVACGVMAGFSQGGGVGLCLANWMIDGDPGHDIWGMDVSRYGDWATMGYTNAKVRENYSRRFQITYPNEELPAARPHRRTPIYDRLAAENAVFGVAAGQEVALWYAPKGTQAREDITYKRSNAFVHVKAECEAVRKSVGMIEISSFAKYHVSGPDARAWLSHMLANRIPKAGRMMLCPMLNPLGGLIGDFTVACMGDEEFYIFGSGVAQQYHMRWFEQHLPPQGVALVALDLTYGGLSIAGPQSRALLQKCVDEDLAKFSFLSIKRMDLGQIPALVGRISFTGDLGYEIWVKAEYMLSLYELLRKQGEEFDLRLFGSRALNSLRLEKSFGSWATEYRPIYGPTAAGMDRFVDFTKNDFIGRDAALIERNEGPENRIITLAIETQDADVMGDEPIWHNDQVVGWVTSGGYAHHTDHSLALGYVDAQYATKDDFSVEILGVRCDAKRQAVPVFDPSAAKMRG